MSAAERSSDEVACSASRSARSTAPSTAGMSGTRVVENRRPGVGEPQRPYLVLVRGAEDLGCSSRAVPCLVGSSGPAPVHPSPCMVKTVLTYQPYLPAGGLMKSKITALCVCAGLVFAAVPLSTGAGAEQAVPTECREDIESTADRWGDGSPTVAEVNEAMERWEELCGADLPEAVPASTASDPIPSDIEDLSPEDIFDLAPEKCTTEGTLAGQANWDLIVSGQRIDLLEEPGTAEASMTMDDTLRVSWAGGYSDLGMISGSGAGHFLVAPTAGWASVHSVCGSIDVPNAPDPDNVLCRITFSYVDTIIGGGEPLNLLELEAFGSARSPVCK